MLKLFATLILLIGVAGVFVTFEGTRLPVSHVASRSVVVPALPDSVYATITDFANAPTWRTSVDRVDIVPSEGGKTRFSEISGRDILSIQVDTAVPPSRLVTRIIGEGLDFGGSWAYAVQPEGDGTRITITEHGEVYNPFFRFMSRYVFGHTMTLDTYLKALGTKFGAVVVPADAPIVPLR